MDYPNILNFEITYQLDDQNKYLYLGLFIWIN